MVSMWMISVLFYQRWGKDGPVFPNFGKKKDGSGMRGRFRGLPVVTALCASDEGKPTGKC